MISPWWLCKETKREEEEEEEEGLLPESISSGAQRKYFSRPGLVMYSFATPPIKLKPGHQIGGGGLLIANTWTNHYDGPIRNSLDHIYYTPFCRCRALLRHSPAMATCAIMLIQNHFPESNRHMLDFVHPIVLCRITYRAPLEILWVLTYFLISKEDKQLQSLI